MLNECVICDEKFKETADNPGCICEDCRAKMKPEPEQEIIPPTPKHFYRIK
jgi:hypothetical protein